MVLGIIAQLANATDRARNQVDSEHRRNGVTSANGHHPDLAREDLIVLEVVGTLRTPEESQAFETRLLEITEDPPLRLALDFSRLDYIDAQGLRVILMASQRVVRAGGRLVICGVDGRVARAVRESGIDHIVPSFESLAEAMPFLA